MKNPAEMTNDQIVRWLDKSRNTMMNLAWRGISSSSVYSYNARDRFESLKDEAIIRNIWKTWCDSYSYHYEADSIGFWA